jgi:predicted transcriptional regulator
MISPLTIKIMIHYHVSPEEIEHVNAPAVQSTIRGLIQHEMLEKNAKRSNKYLVTEKGKKWLEMLEDTPFPVQVIGWDDPRKFSKEY